MLKLILNFLNSISSKNPIENSIPARPKTKNVLDIKFKSSKFKPIKTENEYTISQTHSENKNKNKKLEKFTKNPNKENQKIKFIKSIH